MKKGKKLKKIKWEKGIKSSICNFPLKGKMLLPYDKIKLGMHVTAKYQELDIHLEIDEEISPNSFKATVMYFEPINAQQPIDLLVDDEVSINRDEICGLFED
jgi:hypothetical protein